MQFEVIDKTNNYNFSASTEQAELFIIGEVGWDVLASYIERDLKSLKGQPITVYFDSCGGSVFEANTIYNAFKNYNGFKTGVVKGIAASAASYILCAMDKVQIEKNGLIMLHNPLVPSVAGNADELKHIAATLEKLQANYVSTYSEFTHQPVDKVQEMMNNETYLTAEEALALGFVTEILSNTNSTLLAEDFKINAKARFAAYIDEKKFMKKQDEFNKDESGNATEEVVTEVRQEEEVKKTVEEVETPSAEETAEEVKEETVEEVKEDEQPAEVEEDKDAIIEALNAEIESLKLRIAELESNVQQEVEKQEVEAKRKSDILAYASKYNKAGGLNTLLASALATKQSLEEFKDSVVVELSKSRPSYKAILANSETKPDATKVFKSRADYFNHYKALVENGNIEEASKFYKQHSKIF